MNQDSIPRGQRYRRPEILVNLWHCVSNLRILLGSPQRLSNSLAVGILVVINQPTPYCALRKLLRVPSRLLGLLGILQRHASQRAGYPLHHLLGILIIARQHVDAPRQLFRPLLHPEPEARQRGGYGWHMESHALQRGIAPGLVVGGKHGEIHPYEELIVGAIEHAIAPIQVAGYVHHLYPVIHMVAKPLLAKSL